MGARKLSNKSEVEVPQRRPSTKVSRREDVRKISVMSVNQRQSDSDDDGLVVHDVVRKIGCEKFEIDFGVSDQKNSHLKKKPVLSSRMTKQRSASKKENIAPTGASENVKTPRKKSLGKSKSSSSATSSLSSGKRSSPSKSSQASSPTPPPKSNSSPPTGSGGRKKSLKEFNNRAIRASFRRSNNQSSNVNNTSQTVSPSNSHTSAQRPSSPQNHQERPFTSRPQRLAKRSVKGEMRRGKLNHRLTKEVISEIQLGEVVMVDLA